MFLKTFAAFMIGLVNQLILRNVLQIYLPTCQEKKVLKVASLTIEQNNNKLWYNCRKGGITVSKAHSVLTKMNKNLKPSGGCVDIWSLCKNISGLSFSNPKYGRTKEIETANKFFELMKKKHKNLVISEYGLFLDKTNCFIGAGLDHLMTCDCCEDACVETKCLLSINYEKPDKKNLDYLDKSDREIKLKTNRAFFTQCIIRWQ